MRCSPVRSFALAAFLVACGPTSRSSEPPSSSGEATSPQPPGWPPLPEVETTAAWRMAELAASLPELPAAEGTRWAREVFVPWMEQREAVIREAAELRRAVRAGPTADQAVAAALHGAILQSTFDSLRGAGVERIDPEAAGALDGPAQVLADKARRAYEVCHQLALDSGVVLDAWRRSCDEHLAALPSD